MTEKTCAVCQELKPTSEYYFHDRSKYGRNSYYDSKCKRCRIEHNKACRLNRLEHYKEKRRENYRRRKAEGRQTKGVGKYSSDSKSRWGRSNGYKRNAQAAVSRALLSSALERPSRCEVCSCKCKPEAHHSDYRKPLKVHWLCTGCHGLIHSVLNEVRRQFGEEAIDILPEVSYAS